MKQRNVYLDFNKQLVRTNNTHLHMYTYIYKIHRFTSIIINSTTYYIKFCIRM